MVLHGAFIYFNLRSKFSVIFPCIAERSSPVDKALRSGLVYKITCSRCQSCYVGQTTRHLLVRIRERKRAGTPVESHFRVCDVVLTMDDVSIIATCNKSVYKLMTLEALFIHSLKQ